MLNISCLSKKYSNDIWAVKDFDLRLDMSEIICIAGPNGSGKTTIINCILDIIKPNMGEVFFNKHKNTSDTFKSLVAYVPDELLLIEALTGYEYLDFVNAMYSINNVNKLNSLIELYDMKLALKQPIETFSHGMKKKTQLIAAFMLNSKLLILDEPFRGLDVESIIVTKKMLSKYIQSGGKILLSTHDLLVAEELCNRIIILSKGHIVAEGKIEELKSKYNCTNLEQVFMEVSILKNRSERIEKIIRDF